jgi:hypothetical protein
MNVGMKHIYMSCASTDDVESDRRRVEVGCWATRHLLCA